MPKLKRHKSFLKDYANAKLADSQFEKFIIFLNLLKDGNLLPPESKDHALKGNWKDFRECHLGGDMLLVYAKIDNEIILTRIGTHSEIFG
ncbi:MAG: mRNA interferase YafQ [Campylobacterota bacterium]|nr:mRNA interferase YafQ [Campylobacterota bacterium]